MKQRVRKISPCEMKPQNPCKMSAEDKKGFDKWIAPHRYRQRLPFVVLKGGKKIPGRFVSML